MLKYCSFLCMLLIAGTLAGAPAKSGPDWEALNQELNIIEERFNLLEDNFWSSYFTPRRDAVSANFEKQASDLIHMTRDFKNRIIALQSRYGLLPRYIDLSNDYALDVPVPVIAALFADMNRNAISNVWALKPDWKLLNSSTAATPPEAALEGELSPRIGLTLDQERHLLEVQHICNSNFKYAFVPVALNGKCKAKHDCRVHSLVDFKAGASTVTFADLRFVGAKKNTRGGRSRRRDLLITPNDVNRLDTVAGSFYNAVYDMREAIIRTRQLLVLAREKKFPAKSLKQRKFTPAEELALKTAYAEILLDYVEDDFWVGFYCAAPTPSYKRLHDRLFMLLSAMRRIKALVPAVPAAKDLRRIQLELPAVRLMKQLESRHNVTYDPDWLSVKRSVSLNGEREFPYESGGAPAYVEYKNCIRDLRKALAVLHEIGAAGK